MSPPLTVPPPFSPLVPLELALPSSSDTVSNNSNLSVPTLFSYGYQGNGTLCSDAVVMKLVSRDVGSFTVFFGTADNCATSNSTVFVDLAWHPRCVSADTYHYNLLTAIYVIGGAALTVVFGWLPAGTGSTTADPTSGAHVREDALSLRRRFSPRSKLGVCYLASSAGRFGRNIRHVQLMAIAAAHVVRTLDPESARILELAVGNTGNQRFAWTAVTGFGFLILIGVIAELIVGFLDSLVSSYRAMVAAAARKREASAEAEDALLRKSNEPPRIRMKISKRHPRKGLPRRRDALLAIFR